MKGGNAERIDINASQRRTGKQVILLQSIDEEEWQKRNEKRLRLVSQIKDTLEYGRMSDERAQLGTAAPSTPRIAQHGTATPRTPDANDRQLSKRSWEQQVMCWRNALKKYTVAAATVPKPAEKVKRLKIYVHQNTSSSTSTSSASSSSICCSSSSSSV